MFKYAVVLVMFLSFTALLSQDAVQPVEEIVISDSDDQAYVKFYAANRAMSKAGVKGKERMAQVRELISSTTTTQPALSAAVQYRMAFIGLWRTPRFRFNINVFPDFIDVAEPLAVTNREKAVLELAKGRLSHLTNGNAQALVHYRKVLELIAADTWKGSYSLLYVSEALDLVTRWILEIRNKNAELVSDEEVVNVVANAMLHGTWNDWIVYAVPANDVLRLCSAANIPVQKVYADYLVLLRKTTGRVHKQYEEQIRTQLQDGGELKPFIVSQMSKDIAAKLDKHKDAGYVVPMLTGNYKVAAQYAYDQAVAKADDIKTYNLWMARAFDAIRCADQCCNGRAVEFGKWLKGEVENFPVSDLITVPAVTTQP